MKNLPLVTIALGLLLLPATGCLVSLWPLYNHEEDVVFEPALVGVWTATSPDGTAVAIVTESDRKSYDIIYVESNQSETSFPPLKYRGRLMRVGDSLFIDLVPHRDIPRSPGLLDTHTFFRLKLRGDVLQLEMVNERLIEDPDERWLHHHGPEGLFSPTLLAALPTQIRQRLEKHPGDSEIYDEAFELRRVK